MGLSFPFEKRFSPLLGEIYRPIAKVLFYSAGKNRWYEVWMIVDSGADYTILPKYFAQRLGVDLKKDCRVFKTSGIGGEEKVYFLAGIKIKIGHWERNIPVGFLNKDEIPPLLGRHKFLETFEVLFASDHTITFSIPVSESCSVMTSDTV